MYMIAATVGLIVLLFILVLRGRRRADDLMEPPKSTKRLWSGNVAPIAPIRADIPDDVRSKVIALKQGGQLILAIKLVRDRTGLGLKEAKDYVDAL